MQFSIYTEGVMKTSGDYEPRDALIDELITNRPEQLKALYFLSDLIEAKSYKTVCSKKISYLFPLAISQNRW